MSGISYFSITGAPGRYFECTAQRCTISEASCAAQFHRAKGGTSKCTGCAIGAEHAGEVVVYAMPDKLCPRCGESGRRLIGKSRCVSCYNRERELVKGVNAKGKFPVNARPIYQVNSSVGSSRHIQSNVVASVTEAAMVIVRKTRTAAISFMPPGVPDYIFAQMRLF